MKISSWRKHNGVLHWLNEAWLNTIHVRSDSGGQPNVCAIGMARNNDNGDIEILEIEFNAHEMMQIAMGEWHLKNREYGEKMMRLNRRQAGIE